MKKQEQDLFYNQKDNVLPFISAENQVKIDFVKAFLERRVKVDEFEDYFVIFDVKIEKTSIVYLLFFMLLEYDSMKI